MLLYATSQIHRRVAVLTDRCHRMFTQVPGDQAAAGARALASSRVDSSPCGPEQEADVPLMTRRQRYRPPHPLHPGQSPQWRSPVPSSALARWPWRPTRLPIRSPPPAPEVPFPLVSQCSKPQAAEAGRRACAATGRAPAGAGDRQPRVRIRAFGRPVGLPQGCLAPGPGPVRIRRHAARPDARRRPTPTGSRSGAAAAARIQVADRTGVQRASAGDGFVRGRPAAAGGVLPANGPPPPGYFDAPPGPDAAAPHRRPGRLAAPLYASAGMTFCSNSSMPERS